MRIKGTILYSHRGYDVVQLGPTDFEIWNGNCYQTSSGAAWGCICWIDERLSP
jgi:hypothetical protein